MKTILKSVTAIAILLAAGNSSAQSGTPQKKIRIKTVEVINGKTISVDTVLINPTPEQLKQFNIDLPELPEVPKVPEVNGVPKPPTPPAVPERSKCIVIKKIINDDSTALEDHLIFEEGNQHGEEMRIDISNLDDNKTVIVKNKVRIDSDSGTTATMIMIVKNVEIVEPSESERKAQRKNFPGDNKLKVEQLNFYPNPNNGKFNLSFNLKEKATTTISIFNSEGKKVYDESLQDFSGDYNKQIDLSGSPNGIYFLNVSQGKNNLVKKIVIQ
jgi:hypothetical protein